MNYRVEVIADSSGQFVGNMLEFDSPAEARRYAHDLYARWTAVRDWRVVDADGVVVESSQKSQ